MKILNNVDIMSKIVTHLDIKDIINLRDAYNEFKNILIKNQYFIEHTNSNNVIMSGCDSMISFISIKSYIDINGDIYTTSAFYSYYDIIYTTKNNKLHGIVRYYDNKYNITMEYNNGIFIKGNMCPDKFSYIFNKHVECTL